MTKKIVTTTDSLGALRELSHQVFARIREGIYAVDAEGRFTFVAGAAERVLGWTEEELLGRSAHETLHYLQPDGSAFPLEECPVEQARQAGESFEGEIMLVRRDSTLVPVYLSSYPVIDGGVVVRHLGVFRDLTPEHEVAAALEVKDSQLRQAQKMEAIGQLAGGIAHDFNNLLTVINGFAELVLDLVGAQEPLHGHVQQIIEAGERAAWLTGQLLAFSRQQVLQSQLMDVNDLISRTQQLLERLLGEDIRLETHLSQGLRCIDADPGQVTQVVLNLAANARDAMPDGGSLVIETRNVDLDESFVDAHLGSSPGRYVVLSVTDNGTGMDAETRRRIFEPFFTTKETGHGTGLGLATVYGIIKQSGGYISVYSEPGQGSVFNVYLPACPTDAYQNDTERRDSDMLPASRGRILIVEDDQNIRAFAREVLQRAGYLVESAENSQEALGVWLRTGHAFDLLMTDVVMPGTNGIDLARILQRDDPGLRVLFTSGFPGHKVVAQDLIDDEQNFLRKPFGIAALTSKVQALLARPA
jgi:PAS domain S-box-containing protein